MNIFVWRPAMERVVDVKVGLTDEELTQLAAGETVTGRFPSEAMTISFRVIEEEA